MEVSKITFDNNNIYVEMKDGKKGCHPLKWFPRLDNATKEQLGNYQLSPFGIHWPELDEDLSFDGFLNHTGPKKEAKKV